MNKVAQHKGKKERTKVGLFTEGRKMGERTDTMKRGLFYDEKRGREGGWQRV